MPGVYNLSVDEAVKEVREARALGVLSVILFGLPEKKDEVATGAWAEDGIVQKAARAIKSEVRDVVVMGDVCLCEYMSHGHCGIVEVNGEVSGKVNGNGEPQSLGAAAAAPPVTAEYEIVNDASLELLARTSVSLARAGVDVIAPSDMMDGRVGAIRAALDQFRGVDRRFHLRGRAAGRALPGRTGRAGAGPGRGRRGGWWQRAPRRQSSLRVFTDHFARRRIRRRSSATAALTRWMGRTSARRCGRSS